MKGLILASGMGRRLAEQFPDTPKCLLPLNNGQTILDRQLNSLHSQGINDVIITTGFLHEKICDYVADKYSYMNFVFVHNELYAETNYIYSLYLCRECIDSDLVLMHADLVFDAGLFGQLVAGSGSNVLVRDEYPTSDDEKDFKGFVVDGVVKKVAIDLSGNNVLPLAPLYKLLKSDAILWFQEMETFVERGDVLCYAENALNMITDKVKIKALLYKNKLCGEVDTYDDLIKMQKNIIAAKERKI